MTEDDKVEPGKEQVPADKTDKAIPAKEIGGRDGPDPVRYGDWEKGGIAVDF
jgi:hypothetical protein